MGSSTLRFCQQGFDAHDAMIQIWLFQLVETIDSLPVLPDYLQAFRDNCFEQASLDFNFGYVLDLDTHLRSAEHIDQVIELSQKTLTHLSAYGPVIHCEQLNLLSHATEAAFFTRDLPIETLTRTGDYFIKLLAQTLRPEECDARYPVEPVA